MSRVYIHELVDIIGPNRARYMEHATTRWGPIGRAERRQRCFGVWGVVGSTGRWPQVVNLWEYASWDDLAHNFAVELDSPSMQDPALAEWWAEAAQWRSGGFDRILVAADWSPTLDDLMASAGTRCGYAHEIVDVQPGAAAELLESVRERGRALHDEVGVSLVGAFTRAMADDDQVVLLWSFAEWSTWARHEAALADVDAPLHRWRAEVRPMVRRWERTLLTDAESSPLRLGRQPG